MVRRHLVVTLSLKAIKNQNEALVFYSHQINLNTHQSIKQICSECSSDRLPDNSLQSLYKMWYGKFWWAYSALRKLFYKIMF